MRLIVCIYCPARYCFEDVLVYSHLKQIAGVTNVLFSLLKLLFILTTLEAIMRHSGSVLLPARGEQKKSKVTYSSSTEHKF